MRLALFTACLVSCAAYAQESEIQRALMQRQQQSEAFSLQLRQSQQRLQTAPGDLGQQQYLDSRYLNERQALENLGAQQQLSIGNSGLPPQAERQAADRARQAELQRPFELRLPPPIVRAPVTPRPKEREPYFPSYEN
jgi:hypothetical protein